MANLNPTPTVSMSRRNFIQSSVATSAILGVGGGVASAGVISGANRSGTSSLICVEAHHRLASNLNHLLVDETMGSTAKNMALRINSCPHCGTRIGAAL